MTDLDALIAKTLASEQRERDAHEARFQDGQRAIHQSVCQGCGRRYLWGQAVMNRAKPPVFIPEAGGWWHWICWDKRKAGR